jgi:hypothetical protein
MRFLWFLIVAFCFIGTFRSEAASPSCSSFTAMRGDIGYLQRSNADRCEGFYQRQISGTLEFLSLVKGAINYDLVSDKALIVSPPPNLSRFGDSQLFLTASALRPGTPYRMDAIVASGETFRWPLGPVLAKANLPSSAIGIVAWVNRDLGKYYVPVSVVSENVAASPVGDPSMILRASLDIELLKWRIRQETSQDKISDWITVGGLQPVIIRANQPIVLELKQRPSGPAIVDVAAKYQGQSKPEQQQYRMILP